MNSRFPYGSSAVAIVLGGMMLGTGGCRKLKSAEKQATTVPAVVASELDSNGLGAFPGAVYRSQAGSPIHWQPWTRETMDRAKAAKRLVFAVIAMPQQPGFQSVLASLASDPALVGAINSTYVPVLVDGDAAREIGLLTADLCAEIKRPLQLPLFVWMTPDGDPVAWIPVSKSSSSNVADLFNQSHSMVSRMWAEDSAYVVKNSGLDNAARRARISQRKNANVMSEQPAEDVVRSIRQLASFYDPASRSFDEAGGLFPAGSLDLLATAAIQPGLPADTRLRCIDTTRELLVDLLPSAMFDPLDGGVFTSRRGTSWALPSFSRDCLTQGRVAIALMDAYRATGDQRALEKALGLITFSEKTYLTTEGLFSVGMSVETNPASWLWSVEDIEKELPPEDASWWIKATQMKGLGNLPSEVDPRREFFRCNSLGIGQSLTEIASAQSQSPETFAPRFDSARKILLKVRNARLGPMVRDDCSHAAATFRMVSAYAAAFGVTGDDKFLKKAVDLLEKARAAFAEGPKLREFSKDAPKSLGEGRAFIYGLALQAAIDVSAITSDDKWLVWSEDLATTAAELFTDSEFLKECPDDAKIIDLPVTDLVMLFDDSTAGMISFAECRLAERGRPLVKTFSELATPLPTYSVDRPILHTDLLQATIAREFKVTVIAGANISADLKLATERLPPRMIQRRAAKPADEIPPGMVKVLFSNDKSRLVSTVQALQEAVLPSNPKL
ncbi:MAG: DUF255 domain-containing protein [Luteolibacter sp.]|uniref:DUF255 domain-containing protein n=1 Tax=Luteolibacter sp. TaxID=1962973 RepID=UPI0032635983